MGNESFRLPFSQEVFFFFARAVPVSSFSLPYFPQPFRGSGFHPTSRTTGRWEILRFAVIEPGRLHAFGFGRPCPEQ